MDEQENMQKVTAKIILEIMGAPKEHIEKTLKDYVEKIKEDKQIKITKEDFAPAEKQKKLFSAFVELDIEFISLRKLIDFCFDAMPSSVEIISPESISMESQDFSSMLNDLQASLHDNDMVVKTLRAKNKILDNNAKKILRNFITFLIEKEPKDIDFISNKLGIKTEQIKLFLDEMIREGKLEKKDGGYSKVD